MEHLRRWPWEMRRYDFDARVVLLNRAWLCGALPTRAYVWLWCSLWRQRETWRWN